MVVKDFRAAGLPAAEVAIMAFTHMITQHAYKVTPRDIEGLRSYGLFDEEILDIAAAAAARNFFSRLLDAIGAEPDPAYQELDPAMRETLTVGRPLKPKAS